jgi:hypothetical protein
MPPIKETDRRQLNRPLPLKGYDSGLGPLSTALLSLLEGGTLPLRTAFDGLGKETMADSFVIQIQQHFPAFHLA